MTLSARPEVATASDLASDGDNLKCTFKDCKYFDKQFNNKAFSDHKHRYHGESYTFKFTDQDGNAQCVDVKRFNNVLACPFCSKEYLLSDSLRKHITSEQGDCSDDDVSGDSNLAAVPTVPTLTETPTRTTNHNKLHDYNQAIVHSCQSMDSSVEDREKNQWIIEQLKLEPFSLIFRDHKNSVIEYNALSHHDNIIALNGHTFECNPIIPSKRSRDDSVAKSNVCDDLTSMIYRSPYQRMLGDRDYVELDENMALLLNKDWIHEPHIKFACAQILAGSILMNMDNGETILINTVEAYGRSKHVDIHRELSATATSISTITPMYPNIWPCTQTTRDGSKLVIGTQSSNFLVTSIVCLNRSEDPKVGPSSFSFPASPKHTKIFIDQESWQKAKELESDESARCIELFNLIGQARQLRSHFHHSSTYSLCRASSFLALPHNCQPFTIFTYCNKEGVHKSTDNESASMIASRLFHQIGYNVIKSPTQATIRKEFVMSLFSELKGDIKVKDHFRDLIHLFGEKEELFIIGNKELSKQVLMDLASLIGSDISRANMTVASNIKTRLHSY